MLLKPAELSQIIRVGELFPPTRDELSQYGETGCWQAGSEALNLALQCIWAAEEEAADDLIKLAAEWLGAKELRGKPWGDPPIFFESVHRQARAIAGWVTGADSPLLWREAAAATAHWANADTDQQDAEWFFQAALCQWLSGSSPDFSALAGARRELVEKLANKTFEAARAFADYFRSQEAAGFEYIGEYTQALLTISAFGKAAGVARPKLCLQAMFVVDRDLDLPAGLVERGWSDEAHCSLKLEKYDFDLLSKLLLVVGARHVLDNDQLTILMDGQAETDGFAPTDDPSADAGMPLQVIVSGRGAGRLTRLISELF